MHMKFDTESLNQKELSDAELEFVYSGDDLSGLGLRGGQGGGIGVGGSLSAASTRRIHSFSFECDINIFSNNVLDDELKGILSIANVNTQICTNNN